MQKQPPEVLYEKAVLKSFATFTGKYLCWRLFLIKLQFFRPEHSYFPVNIAKVLRTPILKNICERLLLNEDQLTRIKFNKTLIPQDKFFVLFNRVLTTTWYMFNSQFYQQTDGVAMGRLAFSTAAEIYMQAHEETTISTELHPPKFWKRYVDDAYSILNRAHLENIFHHIINLEQNINFTME